MMRSAVAAALVFGLASATDLVPVTYESFLQTYGEARVDDPVGYETRARIFAERLEAIQRHNAKSHVTWTRGLNKFADYTDEEFEMLLGYRSQLRRAASHGIVAYANSTPSASSFLQARSRRGFDTRVDEIDWSKQSKVAIKDQGGCGSCWAVAAVTAMEMTAEIVAKTVVQPTSFEQLVDCTPNHHNCGGTGGCKGATSELAFEYVFKHGLLPEEAYAAKGYRKRGGGQPETACQGMMPSGLPSGSHPVITTTGFVRLPENRLQPIYDALQQGPLVVSVDASPWRDLKSGVFSDCRPDAVVNHAVVLTGFGKLDSMDYWMIRNSWGQGWGDNGHIRLQRHSGDISVEQDGYCGEDNNPKEGVGCDGGPSKLKVCGMCGVLSDTSYPHGVAVVR